MKTISIFFTLLISLTAISQDFRLKVWPNSAPDSNGMTLPEEISEGHRVKNVSEAEIFVYLPKKEINTGAAVVICPGGGYSKVTMGSEGFQIAEWLTQQGISGIVLKYRLPYGHHIDNWPDLFVQWLTAQTITK
jgi:acetyl esterase/lipase